MPGPTAGACPACKKDILAIIDRLGPDHLGIQFQIIANGHNTVPSWTRTAESRRKRIAAIRTECIRQGHKTCQPSSTSAAALVEPPKDT